MVGHRLSRSQPQELAQGQAVGAAPFQPTLAIDPLEVADQMHAEVTARRQRRAAPPAGVVGRALLFGEAVEPSLCQYRLQAVVKDMSRRARQLSPAYDQIGLPLALPPQRHAGSPLPRLHSESAKPDFVNGLLGAPAPAATDRLRCGRWSVSTVCSR